MPGQGLKIIYQDPQFVAIHKPAGLLVHKSNIDKHETRFALQQLRDQLNKHLYPIHRLDKATSGLLLFAFAPEYAQHIQQQMHANNANKDYLLVCRGYCPDAGIIDHALKPIVDFKKKQHKPSPSKPAQEAVTHFQRLNTIELDVAVDKYPTSRYSLVKASLKTGRRHQIRRHFKHISHPIIGCPKYGKSTHNRYFAKHLGADRLLLHAYQMTLSCPITDKAINLTAPPEGRFQQLLQTFNWESSLLSKEFGI